MLPKACPSCGSPIGSSDKFCGHCGTALLPSAGSAAPALPPALARVPEAAGERRQVTVMFVDVVGSTALSGRLDPEDLRELLAAYHDLVAEVVNTHGGHVAQFLGDGALVYFGYPISHEDDGERAIKAGLSLLERTRGLTIQGSETNIRIGLATGLVVVGDKAVGSDAAHEPRIMGETPNVAARLQSVAQPGEMVIAESTRQLIGSLFAYDSLGLIELKGVPRPVQAWKVVGVAELDDRFKALRSAATPFIGREEELHLLSRRWNQVAEEGGKAVLVSGEPGVGKSRLLAAARELVSSDDPQVVTYFCSQSFTNTALYPVIRHIERSCGLSSSDAQEEGRPDFEAFLGPLFTPKSSALISDLLSMQRSDSPDPIRDLSPAERRKATFELLIGQLVSSSAAGRLVLVFEDMHWADASTLELVDLLIARIQAHPILLVATHRPEFQSSWAGQPQVSVITLARLPTKDQRALILAVAGRETLSSELVDEIAERTDGVPLFVEELTKATIEAAGTHAGETLLRGAARGATVPATLHASLMARLDRLGPTARQVAQTCAVIGREFSHELLAAVWTAGADEMADGLDQLRAAGLIFARGSDNHAAYMFKHALVQDAAYSTLLRGQRRGLHRAVAERLVKQAHSDTRAELIARHYREAHEHQLAAEWRLKAGESSNERSAYHEAVENLREGLADLALSIQSPGRKDLELKLTVALCVPLIALFSFASAQATEVVTRAEALTIELGRPRPAPLLFSRWLVHWGRGEHNLGAELAAELADSRKGHFEGFRGALARVSSEMQMGCDLISANAQLGDIFHQLMRFGPEPDRLRFTYTYDPKTTLISQQSIALWYTGYPDQAIEILEVARARLREVPHSMTMCNMLVWECNVHLLRGDLATLEERALELRELATRESLALWPEMASTLLAFADGIRGRVTESLAAFDGYFQFYDRVQFKLYRCFWLSLRARILDSARRGDEALANIDEAISLALSMNETIHLSDFRRLRGEFLIRYRGVHAAPEAEREFRDSLAFSRKQNSLSYELRAANSMANLMRGRGDEAGALDLLEPVFNRFKEGFDTADLISARKTIDELKARAGPQGAGISLLTSTAQRTTDRTFSAF